MAARTMATIASTPRTYLLAANHDSDCDGERNSVESSVLAASDGGPEAAGAEASSAVISTGEGVDSWGVSRTANSAAGADSLISGEALSRDTLSGKSWTGT